MRRASVYEPVLPSDHSRAAAQIALRRLHRLAKRKGFTIRQSWWRNRIHLISPSGELYPRATGDPLGGTGFRLDKAERFLKGQKK